MRQCAFCPSTKLSQEHVWGDWINRCIVHTRFTVQRVDRHGKSSQWTTEGLQQTARVVCKPCNGGWMSDLESNQAKPSMCDMIRHGGAVSILPRGIASIAAYSFKMAVISNHTGDLRDEPYFSTGERYRFAKTLEIPNGIQVWLFAVNAPGRITAKFNSHIGRLPTSLTYGFEFYICTFAVGHVGIQVVAPRWLNPHINTFMRFPGLREGDRFNGATVPLWPSDGSPVVWPPRLHIGNNSIDAFCNRWKDFTLPNWVL